VLSGSENQTLEPLFAEFTAQTGLAVKLSYKGSVDIMLELQNPSSTYDAVWPADALWIRLGDTEHRVSHLASIMTSPVVLGLKLSKAQKLGLVGKTVTVKDLLSLIRRKAFTFAMTSATQSNSGASAYLGFLTALNGGTDPLSLEDLDKPQLQKDLTALLAGVNRSSGSSGWLKDLFLKSDFDAMVNYEALILEANTQLVAEGREPLYLVYPADGLAISDSPLGTLLPPGSEKLATFDAFQKFLLQPSTQAKIAALGRRTGLAGQTALDATVFKPEWGIDSERVLNSFRWPEPEVLEKALALYQTSLRKPSYTVLALDFSGSMAGEGETQLKDAMDLLFQEDNAKRYFIQAGRDDKLVVNLFSSSVLKTLEPVDSRPATLTEVNSTIHGFSPDGGTDIYTPLIDGLRRYAALPERADYLPALVLMTDGVSNTGANYEDFEREWKAVGLDVPVYAILFGTANEDQLKSLVELTKGVLFDGTKDLGAAFRKVKGYN
jgi:Ca-activated chloride channel family protein